MKDLLLSSIPIINETSDAFEKSNDWPNASYEVSATAKSTVSGKLKWEVVQQLRGAPGIEQLIKDGKAAWAVEFMCAETMFLGTKTDMHQIADEQGGLTGTVSVVLDQRDIGDATIHLWPGVITKQSCEFNTSGSAWDDERIEIGAGRWLVRGAPLKPEHAQNSLIVFKDDPENKNGKVSISLDDSGQDARFVIYANPARIDTLKEAKSGALLGCFATALAMLPNNEAFEIARDKGDRPYSPNWPLGTELINLLLEKDSHLQLWDTGEDWDPMKAASLVLPLLAVSDESKHE